LLSKQTNAAKPPPLKCESATQAVRARSGGGNSGTERNHDHTGHSPDAALLVRATCAICRVFDATALIDGVIAPFEQRLAGDCPAGPPQVAAERYNHGQWPKALASCDWFGTCIPGWWGLPA
jgi:hypothetical protein